MEENNFCIYQDAKIMIIHPPEFTELISVFSSKFSNKIYRRAAFLILGAILTQGKRTVCSVLRTLGLSQTTRWDLYHRVLSRAKWSALECSKSLGHLILAKFFETEQPLVFGIDETIERRWGAKIKARGIYRDAVRSSKSHFVKCSGLRWIGVMFLMPISWAERIWALPFLTVLAPSERYHTQRQKKHKTLSDWAFQIALILHRWFGDYTCIVVADGSYAVMELLSRVGQYQTWIVRFRIDSAIYDLPPVYPLGKRPVGRPPIKGERQLSLRQRAEGKMTIWKKVTFSQWYGETNKVMWISSGIAIWYRGGKPPVKIKWVLVKDPEGKLETTALACTNTTMPMIEIVQHFVKRWTVEVTFQEVRAHIGVETQRQWADLSIARTTPVLMALFSIVTLWANQLQKMGKLQVFPTAWYKKSLPTFSDALNSVRLRVWKYQFNLRSLFSNDREDIKTLFINHLAFMAARAA